MPTQSTSESIGLDLYYAGKTVVIKPNEMCTMETDICIEPPKGTYVQIAPRSGLVFKRQIHVLAGVIDADYRGSIKVLLQNLGTDDVTIDHKYRIAQMICEKACIPAIDDTTNLSVTERDSDAFGSTEQNEYANTTPLPHNTIIHDDNDNDQSPHVIPFDIEDDHANQSVLNDNGVSTDDVAIIHNMTTDVEPPFNITMGTDPFDDIVEIEIATRGEHPTLGLILESNDDIGQRLQLTTCATSTPAARMPRWRSTLRHSFPLSIGTTPITCKQDIEQAVNIARKNKQSTIKCKFGVIEKIAMHPQTGVPIVFHDQLNIISQHLAFIKLDNEAKNERHKKYLDAIIPQVHALKSKKKRAKLTRKILKQQQDWNEWLMSEHKQLQQYEDQGMFSEPTRIPDGTNCLPFICTYIVKECGTKKARGVCNGSPRMKGTVTMGNTYAASLDQTCAKMFWAINNAEGNIVVGADAY